MLALSYFNFFFQKDSILCIWCSVVLNIVQVLPQCVGGSNELFTKCLCILILWTPQSQLVFFSIVLFLTTSTHWLEFSTLLLHWKRTDWFKTTWLVRGGVILKLVVGLQIFKKFALDRGVWWSFLIHFLYASTCLWRITFLPLITFLYGFF